MYYKSKNASFDTFYWKHLGPGKNPDTIEVKTLGELKQSLSLEWDDSYLAYDKRVTTLELTLRLVPYKEVTNEPKPK